MKDSDHITVASAKMLTPATATHDLCNSLVCIKTNSFYPSRASWCSPTFLAGCTVTELSRESLVLPSMLLMSTLPRSHWLEKKETQRCAVQCHSHDLKVCLMEEGAKMVNQTPAQIEAYTGLKKIVNLTKSGGEREVNLMKQPQHSN